MRRPNAFTATLLASAAVLAGASAAPPAAGQTPPELRTNAPRHLDAPYVVLLSLDGFRWDYPDRYPTPAFQRMMREGARAERMIPTFPTKTFPAHYSVATGLYAENHGLVGNRYWDAQRRDTYDMNDRSMVEDGSWYRGEPIWVTAERQGMLSASFFFVGTEADVGGIRPTHWRRFNAQVPNAERVDTVLGWLALPPEIRPHLLTLYFSDLDDVGHTFGPDSRQVKDAVARVDRELGRLLDGVEALPHGDRVYVVVVSDHGMLLSRASRAQGLDLGRFPGVRFVEGGPYASLVVDRGGPERLPALRDSLQDLLPEATVWLREDVPRRLRYSSDPRIGDLVILADPGATVVPANRLPRRDTYTHGWDNRTPEMGAVFLARGPGIAGGQVVAPIESVDVYPFLAHLLRLEPAEVDGRLDVLLPLLSGDRKGREPPSR